jgi:WD40 repeat protein
VTVAGLAAGSVGFALAAVVAALATAGYHRELQTHSDLVGLGSGLAAVTGYLLLLPLTATALRILAVRPAGLSALGAWALVGSFLYLTGHTFGVLPFWVYGLVAFGAYALVAVAAVLAAEEPPPVGMDGEVIGRGRRRLLVLIAGTLAIVVVNVFGQTMSTDYPGLPSDTSVATLHIGASINAVAFSPDGRTLATDTANGAVQLWSVADRTAPVHEATIPGAPLRVGSGVDILEFSPDRHTLAVGSDVEAVSLFDVTDPAAPRDLGPLTGRVSIAQAAAFSPDGRTLAVGSGDLLGLWNVATPAAPVLTASFFSPVGVIGALAFSPDGHTIALGGESDTIALWDVSSTTPPVPAAIDVVGGVTGSVHALAFSPDGATLATASRGSPPELWRVSDSPEALSAEAVSTDVTRASSSMQCLAFSPQGRLAMGGGPDFTAALWTVGPATPSAITTLHGHASIVMAVAFSPDGRTLATGSDDGTAKLWAVGS